MKWDDDNPKAEDRVGYFVECCNGNIRYAADSDSAIGITSYTANINGDAAELHWAKANLTDNFGRPKLLETYSLPFQNIISSYNGVYHVTSEDRTTMIAELMDLNVDIIILPFLQRFDEVKGTNTDLHQLSVSDRVYVCKQYPALTLKHLKALLEQELRTRLESATAVKILQNVPEYDMTRPYIPRSARPEWIPVGILGKIYVRDNGECAVGKKCDCLNGIAVPGKSWHVLERVDASTIRVLFK